MKNMESTKQRAFNTIMFIKLYVPCTMLGTEMGL